MGTKKSTVDKLDVELGDRSYSIEIGIQILEQTLIPAVLETACSKVIVVTNTTIQELYPNHVKKCLKSTGIETHTCILPDGEIYKNLKVLEKIYDFLMKHQADRSSLLIAFGGGVIGDMTGFAAATFMRGIRVIQIPTTLLSQVDSSVGGKTAVNHPRGKNTIGAFHQPVHVCIDLEFLKTLDARELKAGFFELVKHGIAHNPNLYKCIQRPVLEPLHLERLAVAVYQSCSTKAYVVEQDEKEAGLRATLNFGHTLGHLIETHTHYKKYLHGEAVGVGMLYAAFVSREYAILAPEVFKRISDFLLPLLNPVVLPEINQELFVDLILHDKKSKDGCISFVLLKDLGVCIVRPKVSPIVLWDYFVDFVRTFPSICNVVGCQNLKKI